MRLEVFSGLNSKMVLLTISIAMVRLLCLISRSKLYFKGLLSTVQVDSENSQGRLRALKSEETMKAFLLGLEVGLWLVEEKMAANPVPVLKCW